MKLVSACVATFILFTGTATAATTSYTVSDDPSSPGSGIGAHTIVTDGATTVITFATNPSPTLSLSTTSTTGSPYAIADYYYNYDFNSNSPAAASALLAVVNGSGAFLTTVPILTTPGFIYLDATGASYVSASASGDTDSLSVSCDSGYGQCGITTYSLNTYATPTLFQCAGNPCPAIQLSMDLHFYADLSSGDSITAIVDPAVTLNPTFFADAGLDQTDYSLTFPDGGNVTGTPPRGPAVPEPHTWALLLFGLGGVGMAMRSANSRRAMRTPV